MDNFLFRRELYGSNSRRLRRASQVCRRDLEASMLKRLGSTKTLEVRLVLILKMVFTRDTMAASTHCAGTTTERKQFYHHFFGYMTLSVSWPRDPMIELSASGTFADKRGLSIRRITTETFSASSSCPTARTESWPPVPETT